MIYRASAGAATVFVLLPYLLSAPPSETPQFRLPEGVTPLRHEVELTIDPRSADFRGSMEILVRIDRPVDRVWLHAKDLRVDRTSIELDGREIETRGATEGGEFLALIPQEPLPPGLATLSINYSASLDSKSGMGLYRRKVGRDWYVFNTFPPIEARRAMPCFDEPRFKTPWRITLRVPQSVSAFSNAAAAEETRERGWKRVEFSETKPLPAELIGLAVGPFDTLGGSSVRVLTQRGLSSQSRFAVDNAVGILRAIEDYTGRPYAFGKLDLVAVPELIYLAVETPGLLTFHEAGLLLPDKPTTARKRAVEELLAHELVHQWFGNLVTQADWGDTWLSEGVATWLSRKILQRGELAVQQREILMREDEAGRTRVVRQPVRSRADSESAYNVAVYEKGAAVLFMLEGWLGEDRLRESLRALLREYEFANATTADFARQLPNPDAAAVLDVLLGSQGVPIVAGEVDCRRPRPALKIASTISPVPVCWRSDTASGCNVVHTSATVELPEGAACPVWVHWNASGTGYYRTMWSSEATSPAAALPHLTTAEKLTLAYDLGATRSPGWRAIVETLLRDPAGAVSSAAGQALR